jgi:hypothetical protein
MLPGQDCLACHTAAGDAPTWTAAGTVFGGPADPPDAGVPSVGVRLVGADGRAITLRTNAAGNFYTREPLLFPLQASIEKDGVVRTMLGQVPSGGCNGCHTLPPLAPAAIGRIAVAGNGSGSEFMSPGEACLACHSVGGGATTIWTAGGTVFPRPTSIPGQGVAGITVRILGATGIETVLVSNAAGNFYTPDPIVFPASVQIEGVGLLRAMEDTLPDGDCNACHSPTGAAGGRIVLGGDD